MLLGFFVVIYKIQIFYLDSAINRICKVFGKDQSDTELEGGRVITKKVHTDLTIPSPFLSCVLSLPEETAMILLI